MRKHTHRTIRDPMGCINKRMKLPADQSRDLGIAYHVALDALMSEHANESAWSTLACSINVALLLAEQNIYAEAEPIIKVAQEALMRIKARAEATNDWRMNLAYHHKQAILAAFNAHDLQCSMCTKAQLSDALREVHRRVSIGEVFA